MTETDTRTARRRRLIGGALVAVLAGVLIAIVVVRSAGEKVLNENGDVLVLVGEKNPNSMQAIGAGVLADVGGCLGWIGEAGERTVVIWAHGTTVATPDPLRVRSGDETYAVGDTIELGGGYADPMTESSYFYDKVPEGCRTADLFIAG